MTTQWGSGEDVSLGGEAPADIIPTKTPVSELTINFF